MIYSMSLIFELRSYAITTAFGYVGMSLVVYDVKPSFMNLSIGINVDCPSPNMTMSTISQNPYFYYFSTTIELAYISGMARGLRCVCGLNEVGITECQGHRCRRGMET